MSDEKQRPKPGPEPDRLKLDEADWEKAVERALRKKRPKEGWPKDEKRPKSQKGKRP